MASECMCHATMGNDFWFLPKGDCLYKEHPDSCSRLAFPDRPIYPTKPLHFDDRELAFKRIDWWRNFGWAGCIVTLFGIMALSGVIIAAGLAMCGLAFYQLDPLR